MVKSILSINHIYHTSVDRLNQYYTGIEISLLVCVPYDPIYESSEEVTLTKLNDLSRILISLGCCSV